MPEEGTGAASSSTAEQPAEQEKGAPVVSDPSPVTASSSHTPLHAVQSQLPEEPPPEEAALESSSPRRSRLPGLRSAASSDCSEGTASEVLSFPSDSDTLPRSEVGPFPADAPALAADASALAAETAADSAASGDASSGYVPSGLFPSEVAAAAGTKVEEGLETATKFTEELRALRQAAGIALPAPGRGGRGGARRGEDGPSLARAAVAAAAAAIGLPPPRSAVGYRSEAPLPSEAGGWRSGSWGGSWADDSDDEEAHDNFPEDFGTGAGGGAGPSAGGAGKKGKKKSGKAANPPPASSSAPKPRAATAPKG